MRHVSAEKMSDMGIPRNDDLSRPHAPANPRRLLHGVDEIKPDQQPLREVAGLAKPGQINSEQSEERAAPIRSLWESRRMPPAA